MTISAEERALPDAGDDGPTAIRSVLRLLEGEIGGGIALLATFRGNDRIMVADIGSPRDALRGEVRVPPQLCDSEPVLLPIDGKRVPLAWTIAFGRRPGCFASVPVSAAGFYLVVASDEPVDLETLRATAQVLRLLLAAGQRTQVQADMSRRIDALVRHLPVPLAFVDSYGLQVFINDQARVLLGLGDEDARQSPLIAAALARLIATDTTSGHRRDIALDPTTSLNFEIERHDHVYRVQSSWIDEAELTGRIWIFTDVTELKGLQTSLVRLADEDGLTNALNRRAFERELARETARARRDGQPLSILMLDIDHFKRVNDSYGHQAGDMVIREVCHTIAATVRQSDILARIGGEEFAILLPNTALPGATIVAEHIRLAIRGREIRHADLPISVTSSIGIAELGRAGDTAEAMIGRGDEALYTAKREGRDRVAPSG